MDIERDVIVVRFLLILRSRALRGVSKDEARASDIRARRLREQPQPEVLRDVRVLILVDEDVAEAVLVTSQHVRMLAEDADVLEKEIAEVGGIQRLQPLLVE